MAMLGVCFAAIIQATGESIIAIRTVGWRVLRASARLSVESIRKIFSFAGPMFLVTLIAASGPWLLGRSILDQNNGEHAFALYVIGLQWYSLGLLLPGMLSRVILPRLIRSNSVSSSVVATRKIVIQGALMSLSGATVMAILGVIFGPWLISIYGEHYAPGRWLIAAFLGAAVLAAPANTIGNAIVAKNGQLTWLMLTVLSVLILLSIGKLASPLGAFAGAIAQAVAATVLTGVAVGVAFVRKII
jgi:O-antigen/teichoic acid export membrane protein